MGNRGSTSVGVEFAESTATITSEQSSVDENKERGNWSGKMDFLLSCLGYAVGLGNVWRFPYLAYTYGGAIFLIPYALSLLLIGVPMFFLELSIGQFTSSGPLTCWKMAPAFQGLGAAMLVISSILGVYYNMIIGWAIFYMIASFTKISESRLPWSRCEQPWATAFCEDYMTNFSSALSCSMGPGYEAAANVSGGYLPFADGLCIGVENVNRSWFTPATSTSLPSDVFQFNNETVTWSNHSADISGGSHAFNSSEAYVSVQTQPLSGSNFTLGLVGFWDSKLFSASGHVMTSRTDEYFNRRVLRLHESSGMTDLGTVHWDLALCLLAAWIIVFLCLIKGIKSSGKVVYFTALFPYSILLILLIRGALLEGSYEGVLYYIRGYGEKDVPENVMSFYADKLGNVAVWKAAAEQIFFSLSACYGGLIALASYNRFKTNVFRDTMIISFGNCLTSFFAGFVIFSFLGALATKLGVKVSEVTDSGIGLAFVVYPNAVLQIPPEFLTPLWSILFFVMLLTLGLDSEFALMETILTSICDVFPKVRPHKTYVIAAICSVFFLMGLSMCSSGGMYMLNLLDTFGAGWNVLIIAVLECICVAWVYGYRNGFTRFTSDIQTMIGSDYVFHCIPWKYFRWFWMAMWMVITPGLCLVLTIYALVDFGGKPPLSMGDYEYETGFVVLGWLITALVITFIVTGFIIALVKENFDFFKVLEPTRFWGPALPDHRKLCTHAPEMEENPFSSRNMEMYSHYKDKSAES